MIPLQIDGINVKIGQKTILKQVTFDIHKGDFFGLIGPNGSGKSTLLKTIASLQEAQDGTVKIHNLSQTTFSNKELAKQISYVPQETVVGFDFKAIDIVRMGRHVYSSLFKSDTKEDEAIVHWALEQTGTLHLKEQSIQSLSGGQGQLIMIAKALAQDTPIILLDEPISALDVYYQLKVLTMLQSLCEQGKTIIIVLHDLNLASRFCNKLLLLNDGSVQKIGIPEEVLTEALLNEIYHINSYIEKNNYTDCVSVTPFL